MRKCESTKVRIRNWEVGSGNWICAETSRAKRLPYYWN
jgi:hypothetical protein